MSKVCSVRTDVEKYLPNYYITGDIPDENVTSYQYLALAGCILMIGFTLFMGTITWSGDRVEQSGIRTTFAAQFAGEALSVPDR